MLHSSTRSNWLGGLPTRQFDLLVVGGGITGAGVALDAASRGLSVVLVEQSDFASGTSSRSSKLIHGGLRYLRQGQFRVTFESASERELLRRLAPHLVRDVPFVFPVYRGSLEHAAVDVALWIYDAAAGRPRGRRHAALSPMRARRWLPTLRREGLDGASLFHDAQADDARLVMHVLVRATEFGAQIIPHARVTRLLFDGGRVAGAAGEDTIGGRAFEVRAKRVVAAAGVWAEEFAALDDAPSPIRLRVTKGAHVILRKDTFPIKAAAALPWREDGRMLLVVPHDLGILVGTTDTDHAGPLDRPRADTADVDYLLRAAKHYFGRAERSDIVSTYAGLRPLIRDAAEHPSATSREHEVCESRTGLILIAGGKLTTYRRMAQEVVDRVTDRPCRTDRVSLFAAKGDGPLTRRYGARAEMIPDSPPIIEGLPFHEAEVEYAARHEMAMTLTDALLRRLRLCLYAPDRGLSCADRAAKIMGDALGWSAAERRRQIAAFERDIEDYAP